MPRNIDCLAERGMLLRGDVQQAEVEPVELENKNSMGLEKGKRAPTSI
jgi:hypothetical protein